MSLPDRDVLVCRGDGAAPLSGAGRGPGHSVLAVPVPPLDAHLREHTARHDPSFLSEDPGFSNAHVTLLGPWLPAPTDADLDRVGEVVAAQSNFEVSFARVAAFPDGVLHLVPEPAGPFRRLTALLAAAFPETPPYGGRYAEVVPHLTVDHALTGADADSVTADLGALLPVRITVDRVDLQWWGNHRCRLLHSWRLPS